MTENRVGGLRKGGRGVEVAIRLDYERDWHAEGQFESDEDGVSIDWFKFLSTVRYGINGD